MFYRQINGEINVSAVLKNFFKLVKLPIAEQTVNKHLKDQKSYPNLNTNELKEAVLNMSELIIECKFFELDNITQLESGTMPVITAIEQEENNILLVILTKISKNKAVYLNPASGYIEESIDEFKNKWSGNVFAIDFKLRHIPKIVYPSQFKFKLQTDTKFGLGIIATEYIQKEELIESFPLIEYLHKDEYQPIDDYTRVDGGKDSRPSYVMLGYGSIYNHSEKPNSIFTIEDKWMYMKAAHDIEPGEEITISYGSKYWKSRGIVPE